MTYESKVLVLELKMYTVRVSTVEMLVASRTVSYESSF